MADHVSETLTHDTVHLDGNSYINCVFEDCRLIYSGGVHPVFQGNSIERCTWTFEGSASRTLAFLRLLYHGMGEGGKELIETTFREIREPPG